MNINQIDKSLLNIKNYYRHITDKSPKELNGYIKPYYSYNMYGKLQNYYVFATNWNSYSKALYFLKTKGFYSYSIDSNSTIAIIKTIQNYMDSLNSKKYMYFLPSNYFDNNSINAGEVVSRQPISINKSMCTELTIDNVINDDVLGKKTNLYVCQDFETYKKLRKEIDKLEYNNKLDYIEAFNYEYIDKKRRIKVLK